jgi:DNA-binding protein
VNAAQFIPEVEVTNIDISSPDLNSGATRVSVSFNIKTAEG